MTMARATATGLFFGWRVVAAAFVFAIFAWGIGFYGLSVFLHALHEARGWPISLISAAITAHYLLSAGLVAYLDDAHRRFGLVATTRAGVAALAAGVLAWGLAAAPWQLFAAAALTAAGWSATSSAAINAMIMPWFKRRRGFALSLAFNGASVGGVIFIPLWVALIEGLGLPGAAAIIAAATLLVLWPLAGRYLRPTPALRGVLPDGSGASAGAPDIAEAPALAPASRRALFRQRRFLTLSSAFALGLFSQVGLIAHLVSLLVPTLGAQGAASAVSLTAIFAVAGRLLLGSFIDRIDARLGAAGNFILQVAGLLLLLLLGASAAPALLGCVLFGLGLGNLVSLPPLIAEREFAAVDLGRAVALIIAVNQAVFSFAPAIFGALRDLTGSYAAPLMLATALHITAAALVLMGRKAR
ncbi:MAG: MFS transporter [Stellaceae bacterium]